MNKPTKIIFRLALLGGAAYILYRNKDRIMGKFQKLSRMNTMDEVVDDIGKTATNMIEGISDGISDFYNSIFSNPEDNIEPLNVAYWKEINASVKGLPINYATMLKNYAHNIALDIRNWDDPIYDYQGTYTKEGMMPIQSYIMWHNLSKLKPEDFKKVVEMVNTNLQYKSPFELKANTIRNNNLPTLQKYILNPPERYIRLNQIDYGDRKIYYSAKPQDLFKNLGNKYFNEFKNKNKSGLERLNISPLTQNLTLNRK